MGGTGSGVEIPKRRGSGSSKPPSRSSPRTATPGRGWTGSPRRPGPTRNPSTGTSAPRTSCCGGSWTASSTSRVSSCCRSRGTSATTRPGCSVLRRASGVPPALPVGGAGAGRSSRCGCYGSSPSPLPGKARLNRRAAGCRDHRSELDPRHLLITLLGIANYWHVLPQLVRIIFDAEPDAATLARHEEFIAERVRRDRGSPSVTTDRDRRRL